LYFPLSEFLSAAPIGPHESDVSTRLSVRIDLASGGDLGSRKIALLEAIQAQKSIFGRGPLTRNVLSQRMAMGGSHQ
jgi:hypothetical protein